ncbi:MAG: PHP domain-containing protein [Syntrophothermus sp.]
MFEYVGAIHIHSLFSDGSGDAGEIGRIASETGLDYMVLTDHNTLRAMKEGFEGWYGKTLLLVGCEINDKENRNHYLAMNIGETFSTRLPAKEYVKKIKEAGGIGFLAHPHEKRNSMKEHPPYPWTEWSADEFTGIEIWNHMSEWMEGLTEENKYQSFMHPLKSIVAPPKETLELWDRLSIDRKVVGIGGIDAHAHKVNLFGFFEVEVFPYKVLFKSIRTHILTVEKIEKGADEALLARGKKLIYDALEKGRCFVSNYYHADASGFRFFAEDGSRIYQMGDTCSLNGHLKLRVLQPSLSGEVRLIRNGRLYDTVSGMDAEFNIKEGGSFRAEVLLDGKAWIFSNHIRVLNK